MIAFWQRRNNTILGEDVPIGINVPTPLLAHCIRPGTNMFDLARLDAASINTMPGLPQVVDLLRDKPPVSTKLDFAPHGRITGRRNQLATQEVQPITSVAGYISTQNVQAFSHLLVASPHPTIFELARAYRIEQFITYIVVESVLPAIAVAVGNHSVDCTTSDLLAAGAILVRLWCGGGQNITRLFRTDFPQVELGNIKRGLQMIRSEHLLPCREALISGIEPHAAAAGHLQASAAAVLNPFAGVSPPVHREVLIALHNVYNASGNRSLEASAMLCAGLLSYSFTKPERWATAHLCLVLQLVGTDAAFIHTTGPAFAVGEGIARQGLNGSSTNIMDLWKGLRNSIRSSAYDLEYIRDVQDVLGLFDMAMIAVGF